MATSILKVQVCATWDGRASNPEVRLPNPHSIPASASGQSSAQNLSPASPSPWRARHLRNHNPPRSQDNQDTSCRTVSQSRTIRSSFRLNNNTLNSLTHAVPRRSCTDLSTLQLLQRRRPHSCSRLSKHLHPSLGHWDPQVEQRASQFLRSDYFSCRVNCTCSSADVESQSGNDPIRPLTDRHSCHRAIFY